MGCPRLSLGRRFRAALDYCAELHESHTRKGTFIPYVGHLLIVAGPSKRSLGSSGIFPNSVFMATAPLRLQ